MAVHPRSPNYKKDPTYKRSKHSDLSTTHSKKSPPARRGVPRSKKG